MHGLATQTFQKARIGAAGRPLSENLHNAPLRRFSPAQIAGLLPVVRQLMP